jgi:hypothetical protein
MSISFPFSGEPCRKTSALGITRDFYAWIFTHTPRVLYYLLYRVILNYFRAFIGHEKPDNNVESPCIYMHLFIPAVSNSDYNAMTYNDEIH